jgi:hypothetical protein
MVDMRTRLVLSLVVEDLVVMEPHLLRTKSRERIEMETEMRERERWERKAKERLVYKRWKKEKVDV